MPNSKRISLDENTGGYKPQKYIHSNLPTGTRLRFADTHYSNFDSLYQSLFSYKIYCHVPIKALYSLFEQLLGRVETEIRETVKENKRGWNQEIAQSTAGRLKSLWARHRTVWQRAYVFKVLNKFRFKSVERWEAVQWLAEKFGVNWRTVYRWFDWVEAELELVAKEKLARKQRRERMDPVEKERIKKWFKNLYRKIMPDPFQVKRSADIAVCRKQDCSEFFVQYLK